jgi:hypothetical protein
MRIRDLTNGSVVPVVDSFGFDINGGGSGGGSFELTYDSLAVPSAGTWYTNSQGCPIFVSLRMTTAAVTGGDLTFEVDTDLDDVANFSSKWGTTGASGVTFMVGGFVPTGAQYRWSGHVGSSLGTPLHQILLANIAVPSKTWDDTTTTFDDTTVKWDSL